MSTQALDIFSLRYSVVDEYKRFATSFATIHARDLRPFTEDCGDDGPPHVCDPERRFRLRCEIDAAFFQLYAVSRDGVGYILDTFPVMHRSDERAHGEYRTKRLILEIYDALAQAAAAGRPYVSPLGPPRRAA